MTSGGDWLLLRELLERGDPEFVDRLRGVSDADALGQFAQRWYASPLPNARRLLLEYLERPLNAYRHEALIKRLFKQAEAAGDDAVMARFLVAFDRSIRRVQRVRYHREYRRFETPQEMAQLRAEAKSLGYERVDVWEVGPWTERVLPSVKGSGQFLATLSWHESYLTSPAGTTMPRGRIIDHRNPRIGPIRMLDWLAKLKLDPRSYRDQSEPSESERKKLERFRLFSVPTRQYLRRRAWRYFRRLGQTYPERYVVAVSEALALYEDADVDSGLALIDNWGLIHALFHNSPVLASRRRGWIVAEDRSLSELEPAPIHEELWRSAPRALCDLMLRARCRPVRQWAVRMLGRHMAAARAAIGIEDILGLLAREDAEVVEFAVEWLRGADDLSAVPPERWLAVAETASPGAVETIAEIMGRQIAPSGSRRKPPPEWPRPGPCRSPGSASAG